ncbi:hypothetical protein COCNU_14G000800 [Cocos nucifera]|uniref:Uncharacterized protein n=1 Tax=Cocos nucifera TaxID=13894 RepID=A0A8K0ITR6_COCNU|nr:hypothetical protein COCNU_14G000800 [Cocos nucifera]
MGFQDIVTGCPGGCYQRLDQQHDEAVRSGRRWLRNLNGKMVALRSKKIKWRCFPSMGAARRIAELYAGIAETAKLDEVVTPAIILSSQWGLPVFSHSSSLCKKREISLDRKLS